jgi:hypothetical protein
MKRHVDSSVSAQPNRNKYRSSRGIRMNLNAAVIQVHSRRRHIGVVISHRPTSARCGVQTYEQRERWTRIGRVRAATNRRKSDQHDSASVDRWSRLASRTDRHGARAPSALAGPVRPGRCSSLPSTHVTASRLLPRCRRSSATTLPAWRRERSSSARSSIRRPTLLSVTMSAASSRRSASSRASRSRSPVALLIGLPGDSRPSSGEQHEQTRYQLLPRSRSGHNWEVA